MIEAYGQALAFLLQPMTLLLMLVAVIIGLIMGVIPGLGGLVGISLFLPFIFGMRPEIALTFLVAFDSVVYIGGCVTAILLNIPGTNPNAATLFDGFPMNQKGEGARAIGAAVASSMVGGFVPVLLALAMIPLMLPIVMAFRSPEMAILVLVGISFIAVLTGRSVIRGLISGAMGVLFALIGFHGFTGAYRFTFGILFLYDGLEIVAVALGVFGIAELLDMSIKGQATIATKKVAAKLSNVFQGVKDVWIHKWLWLRCTILGYIFGIIPGVGGEAATFVAYGLAKQTSKNPEKFGTGCVEGVIAPEAANNAKEAGSVLTTMAFGIPGSVVMAVLMGAFLIVGVNPGPRMMVDHLPLALTLLLGIAIANVLGGVITLFSAPYLARVASVKFSFLFPLILVLIFAGVYIVVNSLANIIVVIIFGLIGLLMKRYDFSPAGLLLGFVLGRLLEDYTWMSVAVAGPIFFITPICFLLFAILIGLFSYPYLKKVFAYWFKSGLRQA